jgi:hypothetical protein
MEFERQADAIRADPDRTESGKRKALRALAEEFHAHETVVQAQKVIAEQRTRAAGLFEKMMAALTPTYRELSPYEQVSLAMSEQRKIAQFEALDTVGRLRAIREGDERGDTKYLALLIREGLVPTAISEVVGRARMKAADPESFAQHEELTGKAMPNGVIDPLTGMLPVAEYNLSRLLKHIDKAAGIAEGQREAEAAVTIANDAVNLTAAAMKGENGFRAYEYAKNLSEEKRLPLKIVGDDGESAAIAAGEFAPVSVDGPVGDGQGDSK